MVPKRFVFKDPDTGFEYEAGSKQELMARIITYRLQNDLAPLEELSTVLEHYWCTLQENIGACVPRPRLRRGFMQYLRGGITLITDLMYKEFASQDEANSRSLQCSLCPHNVFPDKGKFIKWSDTIAENSVGDRRSLHHEKLGNCEVCSCPLRAKVFYKGKVKLTEGEEAKMGAVKCWQLALPRE